MSLFSHFFFLFFFFFPSVLVAFVDHDRDQQTVKLELLHRHHPEVEKRFHGSSKPRSVADRLVELHDKDVKRHRVISDTIYHSKVRGKVTDSQPSPATPASIALKMHSGSDYGMGEYLVHLKIGTPPHSFMMVADTGSDLTWVKCRYRRCMGNCSASHGKQRLNRRVRLFDRAFLANQSSSFKTIDCSSQMCMVGLSHLFSVPECPTPTNPCVYDYSYLSGTNAMGIFANETITVSTTDREEVQLDHTIVGCTEFTLGKTFRKADGVLALGYGPHSFLERASRHSKGGFSYCLVDHLSYVNQTNTFLIGSPANKIPSIQAANMQYTHLLTGGFYSSFYGLDVVGVSADGVMLKIPPRIWDIESGGGITIDSGTTLTMIAAPAFDAIVEALLPSLSHLPRLDIPPFEYCFNSTNFKPDKVPQLGFHFRDGVVFRPPVRSYAVRIRRGITCIALISIPFPESSIIGNILQQNHLWQFDFGAKRLGFAPSDCL